jgi:hypothetical protein
MAGLTRGQGNYHIRTADRGYSCPAYTLLPGRMPAISLCTAAAPLSAGWMHQSRYYCLVLFYCPSAAVAYLTATAAMWPAVWHGGRPSLEAAGPLTAVRP